jgi:hypothetical protein
MNKKLRNLVAVTCMATANICSAAAPLTVGYQGRLYSEDNTPINATLDVVFVLYADATGGTPLWTETQSIVFTDGYFSVQLGSITPIANAFNGAQQFLAATVGTDPEMSPRTSITSVPYALATAAFGSNTSLASAGRGSECTLGQVMLTAGVRASGIPAAGQLLSIANNTALFSILGNTYGGDGRSTFALPDLRSAAPNGLTYTICTQGLYPST